VHARGDRVTATYLPRKTPIDDKIVLNGHRIDDSFGAVPPSGRTVVLGRDEGLRYGRNTLRARATYADGKVVTRTRRFKVRSGRPLAGAIADDRGIARAPVRVRAAKAPKRDRGKVRYRWRIEMRPVNSKAALAASHSSRPDFRPDKPGIYQLALTVNRQGSAAPRTDVETVVVQPSSITDAGVFVATTPLLDPGTSNSPATALQVYGGANAGSYPIGPSSQEGPIVTLIYDRCSLTPMSQIDPQIPDALYTGVGEAPAITIMQTVARAQADLTKMAGCSPLVITAGDPNGQPLGDVGAFLGLWAGPQASVALNQTTTAPFWAVWVPPTNITNPFQSGPGSGWSNYPSFDGESPAGRLAGELVPDQNGNFTFRPSTRPGLGADQVSFHMDHDGIQITPQVNGGPHIYPTESPGCPGPGNGGFQVLVLAADGPGALRPIGSWNSTHDNGGVFWTNGCTASDSESEAIDLRDALDTYQASAGAQPAVVFVQSVGDPLPAQGSMSETEAGALQEAAVDIGSQGGSPGAFFPISSTETDPGYSFVGQSWSLPAGARVGSEVAGSGPGSPPAQLDGFLEPDRLARLAPTIATAAGQQLGDNLTTMNALQSASLRVNQDNNFQPVPFPGANNTAWQNAQYYLARNLFNLKYDPSDACYKPKQDSNGVVYDIRSMYCGGGDVKACDEPWSGYGKLLGKPYPAVLGFDAQTWADVNDQLATEFVYLSRLNCVVQSFQSVYGGQEVSAFLEVTTMVAQINDQINSFQAKSRVAGVVGDLFEIVAALANTAAAFTGFEEETETLSTSLWAVEGVIDTGEAVGTDALSGKPVLGPLPPATTAAGYATLIDQGLKQASYALSSPRNQIASDWGRLQAFANSGLNLQQGDVSAGKTTLTYSTYAQIWRNLLPSVMRVNSVPLNEYESGPYITDINSWECATGSGQLIRPKPFKSFGPNSWINLAVPDSPLPFATVGTYALGGPNWEDGDTYAPIPPPESIMSPLFSTIADPKAAPAPPPVVNGTATALGLSKEQFFAAVISAAQANNTVFPATESETKYCAFP
jgi:hypothetical protein